MKGDHQTLTEREIATILAALLFWREEMCPHDSAITQPYFETVGLPSIAPLSADEIVLLSYPLPNPHPCGPC
jgi:hypothetical protein